MPTNSDQLSFEDLGAIYRVEKKTPTLSAVRKDLYPSMASLIISLRTEYEKHLSIDPDSIICEGVNQRRKKAMSLSKEITEIRMGKIASLALIGARGGQNVRDHLTPEEREYYDDILNISRRHVSIMDRLSGKRRFETPAIDPEPVEEKVTEHKIETVPDPPMEEEEDDLDRMMMEQIYGEDSAIEPSSIEEPVPLVEESPSEIDEEFVVIRITEDLPPFSGPDRNYDLTKEDIVRMPKTMASALINRDKAVLINPAP